MSINAGGVVINPGSQTVSVTFTTDAGSTITVYSDAQCTTTVSLPDSISAVKTYYVANPVKANISMKVSGVEAATSSGTTRVWNFEEGVLGGIGLDPTVDTALKFGSSNAASGAMVQIARQVLVAPATSITFSAIPATYNHLRLVCLLHNDRAAQTVDQLGIRFNNDSAANYDYEYLDGAGATVSSFGAAAQTQAQGPFLPASGALSNSAASIVIDIPDYANTVFNKSLVSYGGFAHSTSASSHTGTTSAEWRSTVAINQITLQSINAPGVANFLTGSSATLYGIT